MALFLASCGEKKTETTENKTPENTAAGAKEANEFVPLELSKNNDPVAKVNDTPIARDLFDREFSKTIERLKKANRNIPLDRQARIASNIVRRLIDHEILKQRAKLLNIAITDQELNEKFVQYKSRYGDAKMFENFLQRSGNSEEDLKIDFERNLLREKLFDHLAKDLEIKDPDVQAFYNENKVRYYSQEQVRASHILVKLEENATEEQKKNAKAKAEDLLAKVKKEPEKFEEFAKLSSDGPSAQRGGDLNYFPRGRMVKEFEDVAFTLKKGEISGIVETRFGYHIIKVTDFQPGKQKTFDEVKGSIKKTLEARKRNDVIREKLDAWKKEAAVVTVLQIPHLNTPPSPMGDNAAPALGEGAHPEGNENTGTEVPH